MFKALRIAAVAIICASVGGVSAVAHAQGNTEKHGLKTITLPAGDLNAALEALVEQTGVQLLYDLKQVEGLRTRGVSRAATPQAAITALLEGTRLTAKVDASGAILIAEMGPGAGGDKVSLGDGSGMPLRLSQSDSSSVPSPQSSSTQSTQPTVPTGNEVKQPQEAEIGEIIVTAQKREEKIIDVPISIVSISGEELKNRNATTLADIPFMAPGLTVADQGAGAVYLTLRGVGNLSGNGSSVGLYLDEASTTLQSHSQLEVGTYDLARVEVLRGPQGTLYGEGSTGGTVRFITNSPDLTRFALDADVAALFTEDGAPSQRVNATVNLPIIDNEFGIRIASTFDHEGGWVNQPAANITDINDQNKSDVRLKALWQPDSKLTISGLFETYHNNGSPNQGEDANGNYSQAFGVTTTPRVISSFTISNLTASYDFGAARLLSSTSYVHNEVTALNLGIEYPSSGPPSTTPEVQQLTPEGVTAQSNLSQELRLSSTGAGPTIPDDLMDGSLAVVPNLAFYNPNGTWDIENHGVVPDYEVDDDPKAARAGRDPQLERAVEIVLGLLKQTPPAPVPQHPPYPGLGSKDPR